MKETEFVKRTVKVDGDTVSINLTAKDVCSKDEFVELYNSRVQNKEVLKNNLEQARKQLNQILEIEKDAKIKEVMLAIESCKKKDERFMDKIYLCFHKDYTLQQIKNIEKSLKMLDLEFEDVTPTFQKILAEKQKKGAKK